MTANVLVDASLALSQQCVDARRRCDAGTISGFTTTDAVGDVAHRLMLVEAADRGLAARHVKNRPDVVRRSSSHWAHVQQLLDSSLMA